LVSFLEGSPEIASRKAQALTSSKATCVVKASVAGDHSITATCSGETNDGSSTSAACVEAVTG
jgi:hypothetical protein